MAQRLELANEEGAETLPEHLGLRVRRMAWIREGEVGSEVATAPEVRVETSSSRRSNRPRSLARFRGAGQRSLVPRQVLVGGPAEDRRH